MKLFKELYKYREFLKTSIKKEFRGKYKKSFLGVLWSFINPLLQLLVYALVFPYILRVEVENYTMFLVVALIPWNFFNATIAQSTSTIIASSGILKKVYFPRIILPISNVTSNLINYLISCIIVVIALLVSGIGISEYILFLPLLIFIQYIISLAFSMLLSSITVYIRDLEYFVSVLLMLWFYLTPVVYTSESIPAQFLSIYNMNPMVPLINGYRDILYNKVMPDINSLTVLLGVSFILLIIGYAVFNKFEKKFAEEL